MWVLATATVFGYMYYYNACNIYFVIVPSIIAIIMQIIVLFEYGCKANSVKQVTNEKAKLKKGKELVYALFNTEFYMQTIDEPIMKKLSIEK